MIHRRFCCNRRDREASFVKREAQDGKNEGLIFVGEIRFDWLTVLS